MYENISKKINYTLPVIAVLLATLLCFYGNFQLRFFLSWLVAFSIILIYSIFFISRLRVSKISFNVFFLSSMWLISSLLLSPLYNNLEIHIKAILETLLYITFFVCVFNSVIANTNMFYKMFRLTIYVVMFFSLLSISNYFLFNRGGTFSGFHSNPNTYSSLLLFLIVNIIVFSPYIINSRRTLICILMILSFQVLLTGSSKGFLGLGIIFLFFILLKTKNINKIASVLLLIIATIAVISFSGKSTDRFLDKISAVTSFEQNKYDETNIGHDSGKVRLFLIYDSIRIISDKPIVGVGVNNGQFYLTLPNSFRELMNTINSQNNITEMLLNGGLITFILYYAPLILLLFKSATKANKNRFDNGIIIMVILKFFLDIGMKSYNDASHVMAVTLIYYYYFASKKALN